MRTEQFELRITHGVTDTPGSISRTVNEYITLWSFISGDGSKWLIATKEDVTKGFYANSPRKVVKSSLNNGTHTLKWFLRSGHAEDPWISLVDYENAVHSGLILYGGNSIQLNTQSLKDNDGANVYIRYKGKHSLLHYYSKSISLSKA